jgi:hypothetical protein
MTLKRTEPVTDCGGKATAVVPSKPRRRGNGAHTPSAPALPAITQPATLLQAIITASADPTVDVGKIGELVKLHTELQARDWEQRFNAAMAACQAELEPVARNQSNTSTNSRYADLAKLAEGALPIIHHHGFALTFGEVAAAKPNHIGVAVRISHRDGHAERSEFHVPLDLCGFKGTPNKTAIHGWGSALTYCRRYALLCAFNVIVAGDDDGNAAGKVPSSTPVKRENVWQTFQGEMRAAKSLPALQAVVVKWRPRVINWSDKWKGAAESLHGQCHARLSGTRPAPKEQAP